MRYSVWLLLAFLWAPPAMAQGAGGSPASYTPVCPSGDISGTWPSCVVNTLGGVVPMTLPAFSSILTGPGTMYTAVADQTIASTSATSSFSSSAPAGQTQTVPANAARIGTKFNIGARGVYTTPLANVATLTVVVKWASTAVASVVVPALPASATNFPLGADIDCTIRSIGASGTMVCSGQLSFAAALSNVAPLATTIASASPVTIDTTAASKLDVTAAWSTVAGAQTLTVTQSSIMVLN